MSLTSALRPLVRRCIATPSSSIALPRAALPNARLYGAAAHLSEKDVTDRVLAVVKKFHKVNPDKVSPASHFANDLGLDSLDVVEIVMLFEDEFAVEIPDQDSESIVSVKDAVNYFLKHPSAK
eukprot:TRINITY_DN20035_c0_g1_i1.p1 TRINITY_DN20035_c0_g1~~TRINITY_DN20035_c0_g1_i1.p1  ORF type:complete len:123 (-),score=29.49 TRINITY_DN20035_c0_g1_i1:90-458(-)